MIRYKQLYIEDVFPGDTFRIHDKKFQVGIADKLIKTIPHDKIKVELSKLEPYFDRIKLNREYSLALKPEDVVKPGIWVKDITNNFNFLIDGWHRAYNLFKNGEQYITCWLIDDPKEIKEIKIK